MSLKKIDIKVITFAVCTLAGVAVVSGPVYADSGQDHSMQGHSMATEQSGQREVQGTGQINILKAEHKMVNITHEPIAEMNWPKMKMNFRTSDGVDLSNLKPGQQVEFLMQVDKDNNYLITDIKIVK